MIFNQVGAGGSGSGGSAGGKHTVTVTNGLYYRGIFEASLGDPRGTLNFVDTNLSINASSRDYLPGELVVLAYNYYNKTEKFPANTTVIGVSSGYRYALQSDQGNIYIPNSQGSTDHYRIKFFCMPDEDVEVTFP